MTGGNRSSIDNNVAIYGKYCVGNLMNKTRMINNLVTFLLFFPRNFTSTFFFVPLFLCFWFFLPVQIHKKEVITSGIRVPSIKLNDGIPIFFFLVIVGGGGVPEPSLAPIRRHQTFAVRDTQMICISLDCVSNRTMELLREWNFSNLLLYILSCHATHAFPHCSGRHSTKVLILEI